MLNQQIPLATLLSEAEHSGTFLKNYLEYVEDLPDDIMRITSKCRELDTKTYCITEEAAQLTEQLEVCPADKKAKIYARFQQILIKLQDMNDEKIHLGQMLSELIETRYRDVDNEFQSLLSFSLNRRDENLNENSYVKQERALSPIPSSSTARNASIVQQVLSNLPLKTSSNTGSNVSTSTNNSASEINTNGGNGDRSQERGIKRNRRTRTDTNAGMDIDRVDLLDIPVKLETSLSKQVQASGTTNNKKATAAATAAAVAGKTKKKRKTGRQANNQSTQNNNQQALREQAAGIIHEETIDPDEPTYCLCDQISYGEMIMCENDLCPIEWFHFSCVSLQSKPKGRWYCPQCRGDRPNVMNKNLRKKHQDSPNMDRKFI